MKKGFTIVEILSVIAIIGVILLIVVPSTYFIVTGINKRTYESKKEILLSAAQVYAQDRKSLFLDAGVNSIVITVEELLLSGYAEPDDKDEGIVIDPTNKESMNGELITIKYQNNSYVALWGEHEITDESFDLLDRVCTDLDKMAVKEEDCDCNKLIDDMCLYKGVTVANYVYYNNVYWQILGVYKDKDVEDSSHDENGWPKNLKIKMITEDVI